MEKVEGGFVPRYPDVQLYADILGAMNIWEGDGWREESMSWKTDCYIHAGLSSSPEFTYEGPDAQKLLSFCSINDCENWPIGMAKHLVMLDEEGIIENHGLAVRDANDRFRMFASPAWPMVVVEKMGLDYDFEFSSRAIFIFQIAGPKSRAVIEKVAGESIQDVTFLQTRPIGIPGIEEDVEVSRIGMTGNLAYELRGPQEISAELFDMVYQAGREFGIKRLGWNTYLVNHVEGGFPQSNCMWTCPYWGKHTEFTGSIDPADFRARYRTPFEVGWGWMAKFNHDFIGRAALEAEAENQRRTIVTLRWNHDDVLDIFASLMEPGEEYKPLEFPVSPHQLAGGHSDLVTKDGKNIGIESCLVYSYYYREFIALATIDIEEAQIGNEVVVHWGDYGHRIKEVRAIVDRFPYLDLTRNNA